MAKKSLSYIVSTFNKKVLDYYGLTEKNMKSHDGHHLVIKEKNTATKHATTLTLTCKTCGIQVTDVLLD